MVNIERRLSDVNPSLLNKVRGAILRSKGIPRVKQHLRRHENEIARAALLVDAFLGKVSGYVKIFRFRIQEWLDATRLKRSAREELVETLSRAFGLNLIEEEEVESFAMAGGDMYTRKLRDQIEAKTREIERSRKLPDHSFCWLGEIKSRGRRIGFKVVFDLHRYYFVRDTRWKVADRK